MIFLFVILIICLCIKNKYRNKTIILAVILLYFFTNGFIVNRLTSKWEIGGIVIDNLEEHQCGILLSGVFKYDKKLNRLVAIYDADRIWQTIQLYKIKKIKKIILSGKAERLENKNNYTDLREMLISMGISKNDIIEEVKSNNTCENAIECRNILMKNSYLNKKHLLITSSLHMKRALSCFEKQNILVVPFSTDQVNASSNGFNFSWLIPNYENLILWDKLIHEFFGFIYYKTNNCN